MARSIKFFLLLLTLVGLATIVLVRRVPMATLTPSPAAHPASALSPLAEMPDWNSLQVFQHTITRAEFEQLLTTVFTTGNAWKNFITIHDTEAVILIGPNESSGRFHLRFATPGKSSPAPHPWKSTADLPPAPPSKPLTGLRIAIDPGHIGGQWATLEERSLSKGDLPPVCEGDMTLTVAKLLKPRLESLGATVLLVRSTPQPVTTLRPSDLLALAQASASPTDSHATLQKSAERLFYRTAEIHARAQLVNHKLKPDLVLCLHFNADSWGDPLHPLLVKHSHFHMILNGAYADSELTLADQRFSLLEKLLGRTHHEERLIGNTVANTFASITGLPPYRYPSNSPNARPIDNNPYLWARNLLANRLYQCPVIFMEPFVMNSSSDFPRLQAGDYSGSRLINGKPQTSIFQEYADALTAALSRHYTHSRHSRSQRE